MALTQSHYRFGGVDGTQATHSWLALEDTPVIMEQGSQALIRINLQNDASGAANNIVMQAQCRRLPQGDAGQAGAWQDVTTASTIIRTGANAVFTNGANCTKRLSGTGTFETSAAGCTHDGSAGGAANDIVASGCSEFLMGFQIMGANVDQFDKIEIRLVGTAGALFGAYTQVPTITVGRIHTIPATALSQGQTGNMVSPNIPTDSPGYALTVQQVGWPQVGGPALKVWLDASYDGGTNWVNLTEDTFPDEAVPAFRTIPANAFRVVASIDPEVGGVKRKLRMRYEAVKAITVSATVVSLDLTV